MLPDARHDKLLVQEVGDELVIYDLERDRAHRLNRSTALIWRRCDGQTTAEELATLLEMELSVPADERVVWLALDRLGKAHLLRERLTPPAEAVAISRREAIAVGLAGAAVLLLHGCDSITAPTPDAVLTGRPSLQQVPPAGCGNVLTGCNVVRAPSNELVCQDAIGIDKCSTRGANCGCRRIKGTDVNGNPAVLCLCQTPDQPRNPLGKVCGKPEFLTVRTPSGQLKVEFFCPNPGTCPTKCRIMNIGGGIFCACP
jgi:hypothetical protein